MTDPISHAHGPDAVERPHERRAHNVIEGLLLEILHVLLRTERQTMSALDNIQASVANLTAQATANATKVDSLITLTQSVQQQLAALQAEGGASADQLAALQAQIDAAVAGIQAEDTKVDAELNPPQGS